MGRPKLDVEKTTVRLGPGQGRRIDAVAGENRRAQFIREAIEEKLAREEAAKREG